MTLDLYSIEREDEAPEYPEPAPHDHALNVASAVVLVLACIGVWAILRPYFPA